MNFILMVTGIFLTTKHLLTEKDGLSLYCALPNLFASGPVCFLDLLSSALCSLDFFAGLVRHKVVHKAA